MQSAKELLVSIIRDDSESAMRQLFELEYERLFRIAFFFLQRDEWAEEIALDVLADLWNDRHKIEIPNDYKRFSFILVRNAAFNLWKKEKHYAYRDEDDISLEEPLAQRPDEQFENQELFACYENALAELPERCLLIWRAIKEEGVPYAELAKQLDISTKTIDAQIQKATKHIRMRMDAYLNDNKAENTNAKKIFSLFLL